jgi:Fe-S oxidoreductase
VKIIESGVSLRRIATEYGVFPTSVRPVRGISASLIGEGNPLNEKRENRANWAEGLSVKAFTEGMEVLYFSGCYLSYDPRLKKVAAATANILNKAGIDFGILGSKESCCGESIRKTGDEELFKRLARENIKTFVENGVKKILVSSPHCYHTFKNEYPEFMVNFEVVHISQYLFELIDEGRLELTKEYGKKVTYHDPCYLGRHNNIYDEPREALKKIPGLELNEMPESRENSLCCGGGGGRIWMETPKGERFSDLRLEQAIGVGAEVLVTSCPYCITHFEESRLTLEDSESQETEDSKVIEIKDITEIIQEVIS